MTITILTFRLSLLMHVLEMPFNISYILLPVFTYQFHLRFFSHYFKVDYIQEKLRSVKQKPIANNL